MLYLYTLPHVAGADNLSCLTRRHDLMLSATSLGLSIFALVPPVYTHTR